MPQRLVGRDVLQPGRGKLAERTARRGEDQAPDLSARCGRAGTDESRCARCRPAGSRRRRRRARSMTIAAGHDQDFLVRERDRLAGSMAASTASRPAVPTTRTAPRRRPDASRPRSALRCRARMMRAARRRARAVPPRRSASAAAEAIATVAGRCVRSARRSGATFSPAASATTCSRSGCASTTASALWPIEPVEPRIAMRFMQPGGSARTRSRSGAANSQLSMRSRTPPCPGIRFDESFTPALRFSSDSNRSPTMPSATTVAAERGQDQARRLGKHPAGHRHHHRGAEHDRRRSRPRSFSSG